MKKNRVLMYISNALLQSIVFYIILAILLLPFYVHQINPDGISYISISQKYMVHDYNAINGYWGPLFSWLLIPFLFIGFKPLLAVKLLSLVIGLITIIQANSLIKIFNINGLLQYQVLYLIAFIVIYFALCVITSDLLFVCLSMVFINLTLNSQYENYKYLGPISGLLGSGLYLTKSYGFLFFIATFFIINLIFYFRTKKADKRAKILSNFIYGIIVFLMICSCWIYLLSNKYGYLTIGTAGSYNHAVFGPNSLGHPIDNMGLIDPPNNTAISAWEDISYVKIQSWSVFDSFDSLKFELKKIIKNIIKIYLILNAFSSLSIAFLTISVIYLLQKGKQFVNDNIFILMVILSILFSSYSMIIIEDRYIWLSNIVIIIIGAKLLDSLFKIVLLKKLPKILIIIIFSVSFSTNTFRLLFSQLNTGNDIYNLNNKICNLNIHGKIASTENWCSSYYLSFYNDWHYYGQSFNPEKLKIEIENKKIDYFLVWKPFEQKIKFFETYEEITNGKIDELRIYKLK